MTGLLIDILRLLAGIWFGSLAITIAVVAIRVLMNDNGAYEANRKVMPKSVFRIWSGDFDPDLDDKDNRTSQGLAVELKTGKLRIQRRLSDEALDEVIGRRI